MIVRPAVMLFWLLLALPALVVLVAATAVDADLDLLTAESGEWAARLLVAALAVTPLLRLVPVLAWLRPHRRAIGLAAFGTAAAHLGLYVAAMGDIPAILAEITAPGIWTGWAALILLLPLALTSRDTAMRALGRNWKRLQRLAYPAAALTLAHMVLVHDGWRAALWLGLPLLALEITRFLPRPTRRTLS
ncbi:MAG: ferric reductase-like transmembrane domain-containing protein [Polymorphobacter sp.]